MTERTTSEQVSQIGAREGQFPGTDFFQAVIINITRRKMRQKDSLPYAEE